MACTCGTKDDFLKLEKELSIHTISSHEGEDENHRSKIKLNRGGWVTQTSIGNIQFGMPPETVKDCILQGIQVPTYYVVPSKMFDKKFGLSFCEFEFPAYFNFFIKKCKISLICTSEEEERIRNIFQETLLGPKDFSNFYEDFDDCIDQNSIPNIEKELESFAKNPFNPTEPLTIDILISFINFDENGEVKLNDKVEIHKKNKNIYIYDEGKLVSQGKDKSSIKLMGDEKKEYQQFGIFNNPNMLETSYMNTDSSKCIQEKYIKSEFVPPAFGITILGCSHGFDPTGSTSGYILWVNGRGIMIDPPAFSTIKMKQMGIPLYLIGWVLISHCHADHDAGALQQILSSQKIEIITTSTIMNSFVRKYSAITGLKEQEFKQLFTFRPAYVGTPLMINGSQLNIFYSLHTIPCIGFICKYQEKSIYFSGDTYYDPENMKKKFVDKGIINEKRFNDLTCLENKFKHDIVIHEAGVPPIHTPISILANLPPEYKQNLLLVHTTKKDIPENSGLQLAKTGIENTYILLGDYFYQNNKEQIMLKRLNIISQIPIFKNIPLRSVRDLLESLTVKTFNPGEYILREGDTGNEFYIMEEGVCKIFSESSQKGFEIYYYIGDYFGESALSFDNKKAKRMADVQAVSKCSILALKRQNFNFLFSKDSDVYNNLMNLFKSRQNISFEHVIKNEFLSQMNSSQKIQFEMILHYDVIKEGEYLWKQGETATSAFLTASSGLYIQGEQEDIQIIEATLVAEIENMFENNPMEKTIVAKRDVEGFRISNQNLVKFLIDNPGFYIFVRGKLLIS